MKDSTPLLAVALCAALATPSAAQRRPHARQVGAPVPSTPHKAAEHTRATERVLARVNAPVAPDAIYIGRVGLGLSVIDLNGFGQSTGDPSYDILDPTKQGNSNYPNNPNVSLQGATLMPPLSIGMSTDDGGSAGVFTLTKNSDLDDRLLAIGDVLSVGDMMLGAPLDLVFNNGTPFGCSQGGSLCANTGFQVMSVANGGPNSVAAIEPGAPGVLPLQMVFGGGNPISFAPHPNPPPILASPVCTQPLVQGAEPTSIVSALPPPTGFGLINLLVPGPNFLPQPAIQFPPTSILAREQNAFFGGPTPPTFSATCQPYFIRQQIGHFLYMVDNAADEVVVLNSNTFAVLARIAVDDPVELAMETNLRFLAVTSRAQDEVVFIDIAPSSSQFHTVVKRTGVGDAPSGIAWDSRGEDILVCNEGDGTVSILSSFSLEVRKTLHGLDAPFAVAITPRQDQFGFGRNVFFAYILERSGRVALFESGPDGINGWGFDDIIGYAPFSFPGARALQPDPLRDSSGVWIVHGTKLGPNGERVLDGGAVSNLVLDAATTGVLPLTGAAPNLRGLSFRIEASIGRDQLTGIPLDLAFDNQVNLGVLANPMTPFSSGAGAPMNGKSLVRNYGGALRHTSTPQFLFLPIAGRDDHSGAVDVIALDTLQRFDTDPWNAGVQSIAAPGAAIVMDYFRQ